MSWCSCLQRLLFASVPSSGTCDVPIYCRVYRQTTLALSTKEYPDLVHAGHLGQRHEFDDKLSRFCHRE